jgi:hypothetical protein
MFRLLFLGAEQINGGGEPYFYADCVKTVAEAKNLLRNRQFDIVAVEQPEDCQSISPLLDHHKVVLVLLPDSSLPCNGFNVQKLKSSETLVDGLRRVARTMISSKLDKIMEWTERANRVLVSRL